MTRSLRNERVLVTGGLGLVGSHLVDELVRRGCEVRILDNAHPQTHRRGIPGWVSRAAELVRGDVRAPVDWRRALEGVRFVFHQAAFGGFTGEASDYLEVNALGTVKLFEAIRQHRVPVEKVVVASSQAVYGEGLYACDVHKDLSPTWRPLAQLQAKHWELACPICGAPLTPRRTPEESPQNTDTPYGVSKLAQERSALYWGRHLGIPVTALRYSVVYGPRQSLFNPYTGVISIFSTRLLNGLPPIVYEDGRQTRSFLYVGDCVAANCLAMESPACDFDVFNVGTGRSVSISDVCAAVARLYGVAIPPLLNGDFRSQDARHMVLDASRLERCGFRATVDLEEGLGYFAAWIREQGDVREYFAAAERELRQMGVVRS